MLLIAGTVPDDNLPLTFGNAVIENNKIVINSKKIRISQGSSTMISAVIKTLKYYRQSPPNILIAGDIGSGNGSKLIYNYLIDNLPKLSPNILALHYILPIMSLMKKVVESAEKCNEKPILIADAGSMYTAKSAKLAKKFDLFTPDLGELAFLADEKATHPAYMKNYLFEMDIDKIPYLIEESYSHKNSPNNIIVKGEKDYIVNKGKIISIIDDPIIPELEAIGGTGDTLTGIVAALIYIGLDIKDAAIIASKANRMAGKLSTLTPASKIAEIINKLPDVYEKYMCKWSGICCR